MENEFNNLLIQKYNKTKRIDWLPYFYNKCKDVKKYKENIDSIILKKKLTGIIEYFYLILNKIENPPLCTCGEKLFFGKFGKGYGKSCGSKECKAKRTSIRMTNRTISEKTREKLKLINIGRIMSDDTKKKISEKRLGKRWDEERKHNFSEYIKNRTKTDIVFLDNLRANIKKASDAARSNDVKIKRKNTLIKKYGVNNSYHLTKVKAYSKISQKLFSALKPFCIQDCYYALNLGEKTLNYNGRSFRPDFLYKKLIIEFNGDIYHANPEIYTESDRPNIFHKELTSKDIWKRDKIRKNILEDNGYKVIIVWEKDYEKNSKLIEKELIAEVKKQNV